MVSCVRIDPKFNFGGHISLRTLFSGFFILEENKFQDVLTYGGQSNYSKLFDNLDRQQKEIALFLRDYHPPEIIAAILAPFNQKYCNQNVFHCRKAYENEEDYFKDFLNRKMSLTNL